MISKDLNIIEDKPKQFSDFQQIRPGNVGSVGDVLSTVKLKHNTPDSNLRFYNWGPSFGSNVQNGDISNYEGNYGPRCLDSNWGGRRSFKTSQGWIWQDMRAPDKLHETQTLSTPNYSFRNKIATSYNAKRTGNKFLPLPKPFILSEDQVPNGGTSPVVRAVTSGTITPEKVNTVFQSESGVMKPRENEAVPALSGSTFVRRHRYL